MDCEARLRGRERIISSKTIHADQHWHPIPEQFSTIARLYA
jgi:hypothetical protein